MLVPGFASRALGQVPCEDVAIRFPIPECWIYLFRVEKHFRYGSVKSAHRYLAHLTYYCFYSFLRNLLMKVSVMKNKK